MWVSSKTSSIHRKMQTYNDWSEANLLRRNRHQLAKLRKMQSRMSELGIEIPDVLACPPAKPEDHQALDTPSSMKSDNELS